MTNERRIWAVVCAAMIGFLLALVITVAQHEHQWTCGTDGICWREPPLQVDLPQEPI